MQPFTDDQSSTPSQELRASERVMQYLLSEFDRPELKNGSRLPTNKELTRRLNVSLGTVQSVLQKLAQEGRIRARRGCGTYLVSQPKPEPETLRIAIGSPIEEFQHRDGWVDRIGGGMFRAALLSHPPISILGTQPSTWGTDAFIEELLEMRTQVDGLILLQYSLLPKQQFVIDAFEEAGKPVVCVNPPVVNATANFVSSDYFGASYRLGETWRQSGRRKVVMLAPSQKAIGGSVSLQLRHAGLVAGLGNAMGREISFRFEDNIGASTEEEGYAAMRGTIREKKAEPPDAVYCFSDALALGAVSAFREAGIGVPEEVSIVGGSGIPVSKEAHCNLTRLGQPLGRLGEELIRMITRRIALKGESLPGLFLATPFIGGDTTSKQENELLGIIASGASSPELAFSMPESLSPARPAGGNKRDAKRASEAFTLVEVLVVCAILAVIAALIFPVLGQMKEMSTRASCAANLRQIGGALMAYVADRNGWVPSGFWSTPGEYNDWLAIDRNWEWESKYDGSPGYRHELGLPDSKWSPLVTEYMEDSLVFRDPGSSTLNYPFDRRGSWYLSSYCIAVGQGTWPSVNPPNGPRIGSPPHPARLSDPRLIKHSEYAVLCCAAYDPIYGEPDRNETRYQKTSHRKPGGPSQQEGDGRGPAGGNVLYLDGHIEWKTNDQYELANASSGARLPALASSPGE